MIFSGRRHFADAQRIVGVGAGVISRNGAGRDRLGMLTKADDPSHKQKAIYSLTG